MQCLFVHLDESYLIRYLAHQISALFINVKGGVYRRDLFGYENIFIFRRICMIFKNLQYLNYSSSSDYEQLTFGSSPSIEFSSNLLELHVVLKSIIYCLGLLDGRLSQLHTLNKILKLELEHDKRTPNQFLYSILTRKFSILT